MYPGGTKSANAVRMFASPPRSIEISSKSLDALAIVNGIVASREPLIAA